MKTLAICVVFVAIASSPYSSVVAQSPDDLPADNEPPKDGTPARPQPLTHPGAGIGSAKPAQTTGNENGPPATPTSAPIPATGITVVEGWLQSSTTPTPQEIARHIAYHSGDDIRGMRQKLDELARYYGVEADKARALRTLLYQALELLKPDTFPTSVFSGKDACYEDPTRDECDDRIAGFAMAARALNWGPPCWKFLDEGDASAKTDAFKRGFSDWWLNAKPKDLCSKPSRPIRCLTGYCFGGKDGAKMGVSFRPSLQIGATLGEGLGFSKNGSLGAQFSGSLGARLFLYDDAIDVHVGVGIASLTTSSSEDQASEANESRGFLVTQAGLGFYNGLFCLSYMRAFDPFSDGRAPGNGLSLYADAAAIERLVDVKSR